MKILEIARRYYRLLETEFLGLLQALRELLIERTSPAEPDLAQDYKLRGADEPAEGRSDRARYGRGPRPVSLIFTPPTTLRKHPEIQGCCPILFSSTAMSSITLLVSYPVTILRGMPKFVRDTRAWTSSRSGLVPLYGGDYRRFGHVYGTLAQEKSRGVADLCKAVALHFKDPDLIGRAENGSYMPSEPCKPAVARSQSKGTVSTICSRHARPGEVAFLCNVPEQEKRRYS